MKQKRATGTLARRLRKLRESRGMTQVQLGERSGLSQSFIASLEHGRRVGRSFATIAALAKALDVTIEELMEDKP